MKAHMTAFGPIDDGDQVEIRGLPSIASPECHWCCGIEEIGEEDLMQDGSTEKDAKDRLSRIGEKKLQEATGWDEGTKDPWIHRSAGMRCCTCLWYVSKPSATRDPRGCIGRCRRRAPTMNGYPVVFETDWCGDHKLDEDKL